MGNDLFRLNALKRAGCLCVGERPMIRKQKSERAGWLRVTFAYPASLWVDQLSLVGDFNGWNPAVHPLETKRDDSWRSVTIELPVNRTYRFAYLADGTRCTEPEADGLDPGADGGPASILVTRLAVESSEPERDLVAHVRTS